MTIYLDPDQPVRFEPPLQEHLEAEARVSYRLRVPRVADRLRLERAIAELGGRRHGPARILALLRRAVTAALPDEADAEARAGLEARIERVATAQEALASAARAVTALGEDDAALAAFEAAREELAAADGDLAPVTDTLSRLDESLRGALADNATYAEAQGLAAARLFVVGWEGLAGTCRRGLDGLDEASLARIPAVHRLMIGVEVRRLMEPSEQEAGNFDSPSPGGSAAATSTAENTPRSKTP